MTHLNNADICSIVSIQFLGWKQGDEAISTEEFLILVQSPVLHLQKWAGCEAPVGGSRTDRHVVLIVVHSWCEWKWDPEITTSWFYFQLRSAAEEYRTLWGAMCGSAGLTCTCCVPLTHSLEGKSLRLRTPHMDKHKQASAETVGETMTNTMTCIGGNTHTAVWFSLGHLQTHKCSAQWVIF